MREGALSCLLFNLGKLSSPGSPCNVVILEAARFGTWRLAKIGPDHKMCLRALVASKHSQRHISQRYSQISYRHFLKYSDFFLDTHFSLGFLFGESMYLWL